VRAADGTTIPPMVRMTDGFPTDEELARRCLAWKELLDFGWRFCLEIFPQTRPGEDPLALLREAWSRRSEEHARANERLAEILGACR